MKLRIKGVICLQCGDIAGVVTMARNRRNQWLGHIRMCRCWDCYVDYEILFDPDGALVSVFPSRTDEDFMSSGGGIEPGEIPF